MKVLHCPVGQQLERYEAGPLEAVGREAGHALLQ